MSISRKLKNAASGSADGGGGGGTGGTYVDDVFSAYVYKGNNGTQTIENGIDLAGEGGLVWTKCRTSSTRHVLTDTESGYALYSNDTARGEANQSSVSFNSDGHSLNSSSNFTNGGGQDYASWTFRKSPNFLDVVTYAGDGVAGREIPHNLGIEPGMVIVKNVTSAIKWFVWHRDAVGTGAYAYLNETDPFRAGGSGVFSDVGMTSTTFGLGTDEGTNGVSGDTYVAYVFAHDDSDESMIKCGSYTGTYPSTTEVNLGFEPQFLLVKNSSQASGWFLLDVMRGITADQDVQRLFANTTDAEAVDTRIRITSNGFNATHPEVNSAGDEYIYMAIRRPNKPADEFEADDLFAVAYSQDQEPDPSFVSGFPVDMGMYTRPVATYSNILIPRLTDKMLFSEASANESNASAGFDYMNGYISQDWQAHEPTLLSWMWRRAPGFFDVVAYEGIGGQPQAYKHNLGVEPEMFWVKNRTTARNWAVWHKDVDRDGSLNSDSAFGTTHFDGVTEDTFICTTSNTDINRAGDQYIAYLFASVPGISKVGSYTGNGSEVEVDCGFTTGARWLLVKRVDSTGDWYFTSNPNNFKTLAKLNTTDAQSNYMSTYNDVPAGFRVTSTSANLCVDGAEYIFYAIA